jgi:UPF0042 nucleotide-binding protein
MDDESLAEAPIGTDPEEHGSAPELVVITGMSGAGRSEAIHTFEDLGYFCIDNLPPTFLPQVVQLAALPGSRVRRVAVVCDVRAAEFFDQLAGELKSLEDAGVTYHLLYLEADTDRLLRRFKETRRRHPLVHDGESLVDGIRAERDALSAVRAKADVIINTTKLKPADLRRALRERYAGNIAQTLSITVGSFGFKYGLPIDADIVMDVRFLPNPYYIRELRDHSGLEGNVREFVLGRAETTDFLGRWFALLDTVVPGYIEEGKQHLSVVLGCTGGMHRSVVLAESTAQHLREHGWQVSVSHRDIDRDRERR